MKIRRWKLIISTVVMCFLFIAAAPNVMSTTGNLNTDSIVTCNGKTYGYHNGHWHEAKQNVKGAWYAAHPNGELPNNPCDGSSNPVGGESTTNEKPVDNQSQLDTPATPIQETEESNVKEVKTTETVELKVWIDDGEHPIIFSDNTYTAQPRNYWQKNLSFNYQLSSDNVSLKVENNGKEIDSPVELDEGENKIKFIAESNSGQETIFELNVKRGDLFTSVITMFITCVILIIIVGIIAETINVYVIKPTKNKRKKVPVEQFFKSLLKKNNVIKILLPPLYIAMKKRPNNKINGLLVCWLLSWTVIVISVVFIFISSPAHNNDTSNIGDSPSATFTVEIISLKQPDSTINTADTSVSTNSDDIMSGITIAEATNAQYSRNEYEPNWDVGSGCNIRARILQQTSIVAVETASNGCTVIYGSWVDPYTGTTLTGNPYQGDDGTSNDLDIDHIIPLKYVNSHGGSEWSKEQKRAYGSSLAAMEKGVYVAVSASENRKESDSGRSEHYPRNDFYKREIKKKWRDIAREYGIYLSLNDYNTIQNVLISCTI